MSEPIEKDENYCLELSKDRLIVDTQKRLKKRIQQIERICEKSESNFNGFRTELTQQIYSNITDHIKQWKGGKRGVDIDPKKAFKKIVNWWNSSKSKPLGNLVFRLLFLDLLKCVVYEYEPCWVCIDFTSRLRVFIDIWIAIMNAKIQFANTSKRSLIPYQCLVVSSEFKELCANFIGDFSLNNDIVWKGDVQRRRKGVYISNKKRAENLFQSYVTALEQLKQSLHSMNDEKYQKHLVRFLSLNSNEGFSHSPECPRKVISLPRHVNVSVNVHNSNLNRSPMVIQQDKDCGGIDAQQMLPNQYRQIPLPIVANPVYRRHSQSPAVPPFQHNGCYNNQIQSSQIYPQNTTVHRAPQYGHSVNSPMTSPPRTAYKPNPYHIAAQQHPSNLREPHVHHSYGQSPRPMVYEHSNMNDGRHKQYVYTHQITAQNRRKSEQQYVQTHVQPPRIRSSSLPIRNMASVPPPIMTMDSYGSMSNGSAYCQVYSPNVHVHRHHNNGSNNNTPSESQSLSTITPYPGPTMVYPNPQQTEYKRQAMMSPSVQIRATTHKQTTPYRYHHSPASDASSQFRFNPNAHYGYSSANTSNSHTPVHSSNPHTPAYSSASYNNANYVHTPVQQRSAFSCYDPYASIPDEQIVDPLEGMIANNNNNVIMNDNKYPTVNNNNNISYNHGNNGNNGNCYTQNN